MRSPFEGERQSLDDEHLSEELAARNFTDYGRESRVHFGSRTQDNPHVHVPAIRQPISDEDAAKVFESFEVPDHVDFDWALETYLNVRSFCHSVLLN